MEELQEQQAEGLETLNWSILFLLILIVGVLLSFAATVKQRDGLARSLCCGQEDDTDVTALRLPANLLIVGTTGFFAWLACRSAGQAEEEGDCARKRSARANLLAAVLVFVAALIRLDDLRQS